VKVWCGCNWFLIVSITVFGIGSVELPHSVLGAVDVCCIILIHNVNICAMWQLQMKILPGDFILVFCDS
jgi:hypothetical protein